MVSIEIQRPAGGLVQAGQSRAQHGLGIGEPENTCQRKSANFTLHPLCRSRCLGARHGKNRLVRWTAAWTVLGIVVNRMNIAFIAINWSRPVVYYPSFMEIVISVTIITIGVLTFRWIVNRMPVLRKHPAYGDAH